MSDDPQTERQNDHSYSVNELADEAGVTPRTVHYYIAQGLLPASGTEGRGTKYGQAHLDRLRLIRELQRAHLPLAEIRQRIGRLNDDQVADLIARDDVQPQPRGSAFDYIQSVLDGTNHRALEGLAPPRSAARPSGVPAIPQAPGVPAARSVAPATPPSRDAETRYPPMPTATNPSGAPSAVHSAAQLPAAPDSEPSPLTRSQWERIDLAPDVELHVRRPLSRFQNRAVDRLVGIARKLLEEDPS